MKFFICLRRNLNSKVLILLILTSFILNAKIKDLPIKPHPPRLVNNLSKEFPNFISPEQIERLEYKLDTFATKTSNQIIVVIVDDLLGVEAWEYASEIGHSWGVGQGKFDNGVVLLIKPTDREGGRDIHIAVGYGLEGAIPDMIAKRICENEIIPLLKSGNYYEALDNGTNVIMSLASGEYRFDDYAKKNKKPKKNFVILLIIIIFILVIISGRNKGGGMTLGRGGTVFGPFYGGWGGLGGGSFGGGSGGGFGGFGGGGFGGGGAGGKW